LWIPLADFGNQADTGIIRALERERALDEKIEGHTYRKYHMHVYRKRWFPKEINVMPAGNFAILVRTIFKKKEATCISALNCLSTTGFCNANIVIILYKTGIL
jgi:hypothetical protein